jgi:hypothetical protein
MKSFTEKLVEEHGPETAKNVLGIHVVITNLLMRNSMLPLEERKQFEQIANELGCSIQEVKAVAEKLCRPPSNVLENSTKAEVPKIVG